MEGVEILATGILPIERGFGWGVAIFGFVVAFLISFLYLRVSFDGFGASFSESFIGGILMGCFFAVIVGFANPPVVKQVPTYKVIISDEVNMNDFMNRYEILEQEGRIYTVKEIMPDAN